MNIRADAPDRYSSIAVFLFGALCLIVSSGYSWGAGLLFLAGLPIVFQRKKWPQLTRDDYKIIFVLGFFCAVWILEVIIDGQGFRGADRPLRFPAAIIALFFLLKYPPGLSFFWSGMALGAIGAGSWSAWQKLMEGAVRAKGHTHTIQFGNISLLLGVLCLAGLGWAWKQNNRGLWTCLLLVGFIMGLAGSIFSGTRGGWISLPLVFLILFRAHGKSLGKKWLIVIMLFLAGLFATVYSFPQTGIEKRIKQAYGDLERYSMHDDFTSSVGVRLEMWRVSLLLIPEKPILGWGENKYAEKREHLIQEGLAHPQIKNYIAMHNEVLDTTLKRGVLGLASLLMLYFWPLKLFFPFLRCRDPEVKSLAIAGTLLPVTFICFGLTQVFFSHNSGVMVYAFMLIILWAMFRQKKAARSDHPHAEMPAGFQ